MKQLFAAILCLCLLAGCGRTDSTGNTCRAEEGSGGGDVSGKTEGPGTDAGGELFRVIRAENGAPLLLAKEDGGPPGRYRNPNGPCKLQGAVFTLDSATGLCTAVERVDIR